MNNIEILQTNIKSWLNSTDPSDWQKVFGFGYTTNKDLQLGLSEEKINEVARKIVTEYTNDMLSTKVAFEGVLDPIEITTLHESAEEHRSSLNGDKFPTGVKEFDEVLGGGLQVEHLAVISGYTGEGKSLFAMQITSQMLKDGVPIMWFQFELPPTEFWEKYQVLGVTKEMPLYVPKIYKTATMDWVEAHIIKAKEKGVKVIVFDLLDFLQSNVKRIQDKNQEDSEIVTRLKTIANKYKVAIILMAHSRKPSREEREPTIYDVRGAGAITGIANWVMMVYRMKYNIKANELAKIKNTDYSSFSLQKNRINGKEITFYGEYKNQQLITAEPKVVMAVIKRHEEMSSGEDTGYTNFYD